MATANRIASEECFRRIMANIKDTPMTTDELQVVYFYPRTEFLSSKYHIPRSFMAQYQDCDLVTLIHFLNLNVGRKFARTVPDDDWAKCRAVLNKATLCLKGTQ